MSEDLVRCVGVGAGLLLSMPFPSLYGFNAYSSDVRLQCRDFIEGQLRAKSWGLTSYSYRRTENGQEFHEWAGRVQGTNVALVATPHVEDSIGPQDPVAFEAIDPVEALRAIAQDDV